MGDAMKRILLAGATLLALTAAQPTLAADAPVYKGPPPLAYALFNWSGLYVGGVVGYGWANGIHCDASSGPPVVCIPVTDPKGWGAGVTLGYNWQSGNWVLGVEGDWSWANMNAASPSPPGFGCGAPAGVDGCFTSIKSYGTARVRVGYAFDRFLPYLTAGAGWTQLQASIGNPTLASGSTTKTSFVVGGGFEYAFSQNFSAKVEYLYFSRLGDFAYDTVGACGVPGCFVSVGPINIVRLGLNYRFAGF